MIKKKETDKVTASVGERGKEGLAWTSPGIKSQ